MEYCALASGSSGNCFYVENDGQGILIDAGISAKQTLERLKQIRKSPENVKAIFITHEHSDHIRGADVLARKLKIPIFATRATHEKHVLCSESSRLVQIPSNGKIPLDTLTVESFSKSHSAADPVSYTIHGSKRVAVITDAGHACKNIQAHVASCDALFLEANHDETMLENGPYPPFLKKWIKGDEGHLSNHQAGICIKDHASSKLKTIILSHISANNNTPQHAHKTVQTILKQRSNFSPELHVSVREQPTPLFKM